MSGFANVTGLAPPTSAAGFMGLLQAASFRGVPFKVIGAQVKKGRRWAIHEYPFRDGGWPEDMGRSLRTYSFSGYLIGDAAPVMQLLLDNAAEAKGSGLLIHPTLGAVKVALLSCGTAVHFEKMRLIQVALEFIEDGGSILPATIIATAIEVLAAADSALTAAGTDLGGTAIPASMAGPAVTGEGQTVVASFGVAATAAGATPTAIVGMATALPPPDANTTYGRYGAGSATVMLPIGTTVATLQAQLANQRAALAQAVTGGATAAGTYSASTDMIDALAALVEAVRAGITDPADQVQVLLALAGFTFTDSAGGSVGVGAAMAAMRDAMAAACRRAVLVSLARASASYQPVSYNDAAALRVVLAAALDGEITAAGDAGEDASYLALKALRAAVVQDLTVRGASLPSVVTVRMQLPLPSLALAQYLYCDASRADEIAAESGAIHPAFCPVTFQALASGTGPTVNPAYATAPNPGGGVLIAPVPNVGVYHLAYPDAPLDLAVVSTTGSTAVLSWSAATAGGLAANYIVQVSPSGEGIWSTAGTVPSAATGYVVTGLASITAYDFQVLASNAAGVGSASAIATGTTIANAPNAPTSLAASAGSPAYSAVALSWTASATDGTHDAAGSYTVSYRLNNTGSWTVAHSGVTGTGATVSGLSHDSLYGFAVDAVNSGGTDASPATTTLTTDYAPPNAPSGVAVAPVPDGTTSKLSVTWTASAIDGTHDAATGYNLRYSVHSAGSWTTVSSVSSGAAITGLSAGTSYDVEVEGTNGSTTSPSSWSAATTASTYSLAVTFGNLAPTTPVSHSGSWPSGGLNLVSGTTPPGGTVGYFAYSASTAPVPTSGLIGPVSGGTGGGSYGADGFGEYLSPPATAGTWYVFGILQNGSGTTIGALVSSAITVT